MTKILPLTPEEAFKAVKESKIQGIPPFVVQIVNDMLVESLKKRESTNVSIKQDDIIDRILKHEDLLYVKHGCSMRSSRQDIFDFGWLDFEDLFSEYGWDVQYDKPSYGDDYKTCFNFKPKS